MSESTGARHYVLFPDVKNAQSLYELMKAAGVRCTFAPTPREADRSFIRTPTSEGASSAWPRRTESRFCGSSTVRPATRTA